MKLIKRQIVVLLLPTVTLLLLYLHHTRQSYDQEEREIEEHCLKSPDTFSNVNSSFNVRKRINILQRICNKTTTMKYLNRAPVYFFSKSSSVAFCKVPKAGSTFIGTTVLALELDGHTTTLFHKNRESIHGRHEANLTTVKAHGNYVLKALVTRNPFTRLYSAYLDKYYLLSSWSRQLARTRKKGFLQTENGFCGFSLTFQEFLDYVIDTNIKDEIFDEHTIPVTKLCNPCNIKYDFICKQETLTEDVDNILDSINISHSKRDTIKKMIHSRSIGDDIFAWMSSHLFYYEAFQQDCPDKLFHMKKLWHVLQLNGFIVLSMEFPRQLFQELQFPTAEDITALILQHIRQNPMTRSQNKVQRTQSLVEAYRAIHPSTIQHIIDIFSQDFDLFGYCKHLPEEWGNTNS